MPEHGQMARTGIEPHVENVVFFRELMAAALVTLRAKGDELGGRLLIPNVGAMLPEELHHVVENRALRERLAAGIAVEDGDGDAPDALARDAPIGTVLDHVVDPFLAP